MFKKIILSFLVAIFMITAGAKAAEVTDVKVDHWAAKEIINSLLKGYMTLNEKGEFRPNATIKRTDFTSALVKALQQQDTPVRDSNRLTDLNQATRNLQNILISEQLGITYGYPDTTFKPDRDITRAETTSMLGHISIGSYYNPAILDRFTDANKIPEWAISTYAAAIKNDFYVNYPDKRMLRPADLLTRAEAAVLLYKVQNSLELIQGKYKLKPDLEVEIPEVPDALLRTETLNIHDAALNNTVEIWRKKKVIKAGNIIKGTFVTKLNHKKSKVGDIVEFVAPEDVITEQGTFMFPKGTKFSAEIKKVALTPWRDKNAQVLMVLDRIMLPDGYHFMMAGVPFTDINGNIVRTNKPTPEKVTWLQKTQQEKGMTEAQFLLYYYNKVSPRMKYRENAGTTIYILLTDDLIFVDRKALN